MTKKMRGRKYYLPTNFLNFVPTKRLTAATDKGQSDRFFYFFEEEKVKVKRL